jgi:hypothetical protein
LHMVRNCFPVFRKIFEKNCPCASLITMPWRRIPCLTKPHVIKAYGRVEV